MKKIILLMIAVFLIAGVVDARLQYHQQKYILGNGTTRYNAFLTYDKTLEDYIKGNNQLEVYALYNTYIDDWNVNIGNYTVTRCNFQIFYYPTLTNISQTLIDVNITGNTGLTKYFFTMNDGDSATIRFTCYFQEQVNQIKIPASFQLITPTWSCKACQLYEWSVQYREIVKAESTGNNSNDILGYIKSIFLLNVEIVIYLFWTFLILMIFVSLSFIFLGMLWLYSYIMRLSK